MDSLCVFCYSFISSSRDIFNNVFYYISFVVLVSEPSDLNLGFKKLFKLFFETRLGCRDQDFVEFVAQIHLLYLEKLPWS